MGWWDQSQHFMFLIQLYEKLSTQQTHDATELTDGEQIQLYEYFSNMFHGQLHPDEAAERGCGGEGRTTVQIPLMCLTTL